MHEPDEIVEPQLSYELMSVLFKVHNVLGNRLQEKYYQRAIAEELSRRKLNFEKEKVVAIRFENKKIGQYSLDFVVEKKVILETKAIPLLNKKGHDQLLSYMKELRIRLGIIANFRTPRLTYRRLILSPKYLITEKAFA